MPELDDAKERARVEEIWKQYDTNNSGVLEKDQAKAFLMDELKSMTGADPTDDELDNRAEQRFVAEFEADGGH